MLFLTHRHIDVNPLTKHDISHNLCPQGKLNFSFGFSSREAQEITESPQ